MIEVGFILDFWVFGWFCDFVGLFLMFLVVVCLDDFLIYFNFGKVLSIFDEDDELVVVFWCVFLLWFVLCISCFFCGCIVVWKGFVFFCVILFVNLFLVINFVWLFFLFSGWYMKVFGWFKLNVFWKFLRWFIGVRFIVDIFEIVFGFNIIFFILDCIFEVFW